MAYKCSFGNYWQVKNQKLIYKSESVRHLVAKKMQKSHKNVQKRILRPGLFVISDDPYGFEIAILGQG